MTVEGTGGRVKAADEQGRQFTRRLLYQLAEKLLLASAQYNIVSQVPQGFAITETGRNVLRHLVDADVFLNELVEAHKRFQGAIPRLSMI